MTDLLRRGWDVVARGYDRYFVERFGPWTDDVLVVARDSRVPPGLVVVACCGPGQEVEALANERAVAAIDLSEQMIAITRERCSSSFHPPRLFVGDATDLGGYGLHDVAAVVSCFGLQQMPDPVAALTSWTSVLISGGCLDVMFWPRREQPDDSDPFEICRRIAREEIGEAERERPWEAQLVDAIDRADGVVERDVSISHTMRHRSARAMFDAMVRSGPWAALVLRHGESVVARIGDRFVKTMPAGEVVHAPAARHIVATKR